MPNTVESFWRIHVAPRTCFQDLRGFPAKTCVVRFAVFQCFVAVCCASARIFHPPQSLALMTPSSESTRFSWPARGGGAGGSVCGSDFCLAIAAKCHIAANASALQPALRLDFSRQQSKQDGSTSAAPRCHDTHSSSLTSAELFHGVRSIQDVETVERVP